jgi:hypothetical protein
MTGAGSASSTADRVPAAKGRGAERARAIADRPVLVCTVLVIQLTVVAGTGAAIRLLAVPGPAEAAAGWLAVTVLLAIGVYRAASPRARQQPGPGVTWQPGEPLPAGVPAATILAVERIFAGIPARRWRGAWLEIAPCTDPVRHGMCRGASATPGGDRLIRVVLGQHVADRPTEAAFIAAHEVRHPAGPTFHLSMLTTCARVAGWLAAGWAVPWPWLLAAVAAIQAAYAAACWAVEIGCDIGAARAEGRDAARASVEFYRAIAREPHAKPLWRRLVTRLLLTVSVPTAHPPLWVRAAITSLFP